MHGERLQQVNSSERVEQASNRASKSTRQRESRASTRVGRQFSLATSNQVKQASKSMVVFVDSDTRVQATKNGSLPRRVGSCASSTSTCLRRSRCCRRTSQRLVDCNHSTRTRRDARSLVPQRRPVQKRRPRSTRTTAQHDEHSTHCSRFVVVEDDLRDDADSSSLHAFVMIPVLAAHARPMSPACSRAFRRSRLARVARTTHATCSNNTSGAFDSFGTSLRLAASPARSRSSLLHSIVSPLARLSSAPPRLGSRDQHSSNTTTAAQQQYRSSAALASTAATGATHQQQHTVSHSSHRRIAHGHAAASRTASDSTAAAAATTRQQQQRLGTSTGSASSWRAAAPRCASVDRARQRRRRGARRRPRDSNRRSAWSLATRRVCATKAIALEDQLRQHSSRPSLTKRTSEKVVGCLCNSVPH